MNTKAIKKKLRTAIYVRVSHEDEVQSLNEQIEISKALIESYCKRNNLEYEIVIILKEEAGVSGASFERPKFNKLCELIRTGKIDAVAAKENSRLFRETGISDNFKKLIKKNKTILIVPGLEEGVFSSSGEFIYDILAAAAAAERNRGIERTISSIASLARTKKKVHGGTLPLGFKWVCTGTIAPIPSEIKEVNFIFDTFLRAGTIRDTLELLKNSGIKKRSGKPCDGAYIKSIIQNKIYISKYKVPCSPIEEYVTLDYPSQVPIETFEEANQVLLSISKEFSKSTRKKSRVYLISGLFFTKKGNSLKATSGKGISYYRNKDENLSYYADEIEKGILRFLTDIREHEKLKSFLKSISIKAKKNSSILENRKDQISRKIKELHKRENLAKDRLLTVNLTENLIAILDKEIVEVNAELSLYKQELQEIDEIEYKRQAEFDKAQTTIRNLYHAMPKILDKGKPEVLRGVIRQLIKKIIIDPQSKEISIIWRISHSNEVLTISRFNITPIKKQREGTRTKLLGPQGTPKEQSPLYEYYINQELSSIKTAEKLGVQKSTVLKYLKIANIPTRKVGKNKKRKRGVAYGKKILPSGKEISLMSEIKRKEVMAQMRKSKVTYQSIADHFNDLGIKTKSGKGNWHRKTIHQILHPPK